MERATACNKNRINAGGDFVLYWMTAYRRRHFNFALERAVFWASELRKPLLVFEPLALNYRWASVRLHSFIIEGMRENLVDFQRSAATYYPFVERELGEGSTLLARLALRSCLIVTDDFPAFEVPGWIERLALRSPVLVEKVDSNGLLPMRSTEKIFLTARSFRTMFQKQESFVFPLRDPLAGANLPKLQNAPALPEHWDALPLSLDPHVGAVPSSPGGMREARRRLGAFIASTGEYSCLSAYLHFGHISAHEVHQVISVSRQPNKERVLDQLTTWRELGFNQCALSATYDRYESLPQWARNTLAKHEGDPRPFVYSLRQLENATTHDAVWNAAQMELVTHGRGGSYVRMLWGKKILEWSHTPQDALETMIHLNNKYALDGRDPNSYTGIFWTLGRYDRPWGPERPIFGLIRYMSSKNTEIKLKRWARQALSSAAVGAQAELLPVESTRDDSDGNI